VLCDERDDAPPAAAGDAFVAKAITNSITACANGGVSIVRCAAGLAHMIASCSLRSRSPLWGLPSARA
jgi:hypothetical protein